VDNAFTVSIIERSTDLVEKPGDYIQRQRPLAEYFRETTTGQQFHDQIDVISELAEIVCFDDVRMAKGS